MKRVIRFFLAVASALIVALAHPLGHPLLSYGASVLLIGLFFYTICDLPAKFRFLAGFLWYAFVVGVHFAWFATTTYHGPLILVAYAFLLVLISCQFGLLCLLIEKGKLHISSCLMIAAIWALLEWSRLFILSGFSLHPFGLFLSWHVFPLQLSSFLGVYGLSFIVVFTNLLFTRFLISFHWKMLIPFTAVALSPYILGAAILSWYHKDALASDSKVVAIIQTGLSIEQKNIIAGKQNKFVDPLSQWIDHFKLMKEGITENVDYIVFPEAVSMFAAYDAIFPLNVIEHAMASVFGPQILSFSPKERLDGRFYSKLQDQWFVSNAFIAQTLSNFYGARLMAGFELYEGNTNYNAALHFSPGAKQIQFYHKQILLPVAEYLPFRFLEKLASKYGIGGFFTPGKGGQTFYGEPNILPSICYDECFGHKTVFRNQNVKMLVSISNDGWFPDSDLPSWHLAHARLRAVELGVPMLRACNTGISSVIDSFGGLTKLMEEKEKNGSLKKGVLLTHFKTFHHKTLYSLFGDFFVLIPCGLIILSQRYLTKIRVEEKRDFI